MTDQVSLHAGLVSDVELSVLWVPEFERTGLFASAMQIAQVVLDGVNSAHVLDAINRANKPGVSSQKVQRAILPVAESSGFESEKQGLFRDQQVSALRPDYYLSLEDTGILFEVERGKTLINNMDLLDLWKCHICGEASILFLFVPQILRQNENETGRRVCTAVVNRLGTFFTSGNETNVRAAFIFGY